MNEGNRLPEPDGPEMPNDNQTLDSSIAGDEPANGALARGLALLAAINDHESAPITRLVADTGLPKPTVVRLVRTLVREGYVEQDPRTQAYQVSAKVLALSRSRHGDDEALQFVQAELDQLGVVLKWPSEFLLADGLSMRIACNNRAKAPIKLRLFERSRFAIGSSAAGIAYLSMLPSAHYARLAARIARNESEQEVLEAQVQIARANGYAWRELSELEPGLAVASVPVIPTDAGRGGGLSLVYFDGIVNRTQLEQDILPHMQAAADAVSRILSTYSN